MITQRSIKEVRDAVAAHRRAGRTIGLVPTMGYLHQGHLSLVERSKKENDVTVVSLFVNPTQFGPNEDLDRYPRDLDRDEGLLKELDVDVLFYPEAVEMYPEGFTTYVNVERMDAVLCGASRPGHFRGVATVVCKLFCIVTPDNAYFGSKDAQQVIILKRMALDLNMGVTIHAMPIVRDADGLALSSRNIYLSAEERQAALALPGALQWAKAEIAAGCRSVAHITEGIEARLQAQPLVTIDYVAVTALDRLVPFSPSGPGAEARLEIENTLVACAVKVGKTRLIDNFILGEV